MRNKSFKKAGAAVMAAVLTVSNFSGVSAVQAAENTTQTSSEKEVVYVNSYNGTEREQNFDDNWKFYLGSVDGAENAVFDDSRWETVNLPHDYSIEQEYTSSGEAESAYLLGGTGWYRKYFTLSDDVKGKEVRIDFGGVYMDSTVWVNGTKVGSHPYGYTSFSFDITDYVKIGEENVITVKVNHQTPSSRWYSGSGIYRSVNLTVTDSVHVDLYGTQIETPDLEKEIGEGTTAQSYATENYALTNEDETTDAVTRLSGKSRYETSRAIADALKTQTGIEQFETVLIATGGNKTDGFADALSGSYLAALKNAPILLTSAKNDKNDPSKAIDHDLIEYIKANVAKNGTIYILGGSAAVPEEMKTELTKAGFKVQRLSGTSRYETNLEILKEASKADGFDASELIVATGLNFADSLSASAVKKPILLVNGGNKKQGKEGSLTDAQKTFVEVNYKNAQTYIVGGTGAVSKNVQSQLDEILEGNTERLSGTSRYETSVIIAEHFFGENVKHVIVASGETFPDGLCGGALAAAMGRPLILSSEKSAGTAAEYIKDNNVKTGYVLGGTGVITEDAKTEIFKDLSTDTFVNMSVSTTVANESSEAKEVVLVHTVYEKGTETSIGTVTTDAKSINAGESAEITATLPAKNPKLWDTENPNLYTVVTEVKVGDVVTDTYETTYGFRYFDFNSTTGFSLNGEQMKLKGVCMHHDQGALGAEAYAAAIRRQVKILKEMGCNSIRVTHNPAASELIEACDELGMMVVEEAFDGWIAPKNGNSYDYSRFFKKTIGSDNAILGGTADMTWSEFDLTAMIKRDYNAPSIIMWSLGNEVWEGTSGATQEYAEQAERLAKMASELDSTRPATIGDNKLKESNSISFSMGESLHKYNGVVGANYCNGSQYDAVHNKYPDWAFYGAETASSTNSRGVYDTIANNSLNGDKELTSYDYSAVGWGAKASDAWYTVITRDYLSGEYVWTGFDYLGEPTPANGIYAGWASGTNSPKNSFFGIVDTAGLPKDSYYFYQSQWNEEVNTLHVLPAWNEDVVYSKSNVPVVVYSDAASVKLELEKTDGTVKDLGTKTFTQKTTAAGYTYQIYEGTDASSTQHENLYLTWYVPFEEGTLRATAYDAEGNEIKDTVGRSYVTTTGEEAKLEASADRNEITADGKDLAYITVNVTDTEGNIVPDASNQVTFNVKGDGVLVGVDNGKQSDHQSFQDDNRAAYNGSLVAIVQSTKEAGSFTVTASSSGLESASVTVTTAATDNGSGAEDETVVGFNMSKNYYVKVDNQPVLPEKLEVLYANGKTAEKSVVWGSINAADYAKAGSFGVNGVVDGIYTIYVTINMIDELGGLLNYSTTTAIGKAPILPEGRPAISTDGTILNVTFPVEWEEIQSSDYAEAGIFTVNGKANVLGEEMSVTAAVRVQNETISIGDSISKEALKVTQDIEENLQSDSLDAIKDGITNPSSVSSGTNSSIWTNYSNSEVGDNKAEIVFEYATQQRFGEFVVHHYKDGWSAAYPDADTTEIYTSNDGSEWTKLDVKETIGEETASGNVATKPYSYSFTPTTVTFVKFCFTNSSASAAAGFTCTGITEIELKLAKGTFTTYGTTALSSLTVDGKALTEKELVKNAYYTLNTAAKVESAEGADNAAVTVLPVNDGMIRIIIESEDHTKREVFTIYLGQEAPEDPTDASRDYDLANLTYTAGSAQGANGNEGPISYAFDEKEETFWHSEWNPSWYGTDECSKHLWVEMTMSEATVVDAVRYLPRGGNGDITSYRVEGTADGTTWKTLTSGEWDRSDSDWKLAKFDAQKLLAVRLVVTGSYSDSKADKFASARELRLRTSEK